MVGHFAFLAQFKTKNGIRSGFLVFGVEETKLVESIRSAGIYPINMLKIASAASRAGDKVAETFDIDGDPKDIQILPVYSDPRSPEEFNHG